MLELLFNQFNWTRSRMFYGKNIFKISKNEVLKNFRFP